MYDQFLTTRSIFFTKQTLWLILAYIGIRALSFATAQNTIAQAFIVFAVLMTFAVLFYKNRALAWYMLFGELLLSGAGHFFSFLGLSLRTLLLGTFLILWIILPNNIRKSGLSVYPDINHYSHLRIPHKLFYLLLLLGGYVIFAILNGKLQKHEIMAIIRDAIPYGFFLLLVPAYHIFHNERGRAVMSRLIIAYIIGSALFGIFTLILFSSGMEQLHGDYYSWFRDVAIGKITDMGNGFYRIVLSEQLLLAPLTLLIASLLMRKEKHHWGWYVLLLTLTLSLALSLSRTYWLALGVGLLFLKYKHSWMQWVKVSAGTLASLLLMFSLINVISSRGQSSGLELLGLRFGGLTRPQTELSAATRAELLQPIFQLISTSPLIGTGLGATVPSIVSNSYLSISNSNTSMLTTEFDWGYLEMLAELGIVGTILFLAIITSIIILLIRRIRAVSDYHDFYVGLLAGVISLLVMNVTAPALFHVFGIFFLVITTAIAMKPHTLLDDIVVVLYRVFRRVCNKQSIPPLV